MDQTLTRMSENTDYYLLEENNSFVIYYSIGQIFVTIICGAIQVCFIKKLFASNISKRYQQKA
jgi:hypothetical protein